MRRIMYRYTYILYQVRTCTEVAVPDVSPKASVKREALSRTSQIIKNRKPIKF